MFFLNWEHNQIFKINTYIYNSEMSVFISIPIVLLSIVLDSLTLQEAQVATVAETSHSRLWLTGRLYSFLLKTDLSIMIHVFVTVILDS